MMKYDTDYMPTTEDAEADRCYIATWDGDENDGTATSYGESEFENYRHTVIAHLDGEWWTEMDDTGVYLLPRHL